MITESQKRALQAKTMLDSGRDAKEVARELGYKNVNGMMGAIALNAARSNPSVPVNRAPAPPEKAAIPVFSQPIRLEKPIQKEAPESALDAIKGIEQATDESSITVNCGNILLTYNPPTDSVRLNISGNPHYLWISARNSSITKTLLSLRSAAGAMALLLEEKKNDEKK